MSCSGHHHSPERSGTKATSCRAVLSFATGSTTLCESRCFRNHTITTSRSTVSDHAATSTYQSQVTDSAYQYQRANRAATTPSTRSLSARSSQRLPHSVIGPRARASQPSIQSVNPATNTSSNEASHQPRKTVATTKALATNRTPVIRFGVTDCGKTGSNTASMTASKRSFICHTFIMTISPQSISKTNYMH